MKMSLFQLHDDHLNSLKSKVNQLKQICQLSNLYLSNYFLDLKNGLTYLIGLSAMRPITGYKLSRLKNGLELESQHSRLGLRD